MPQHVVSFMHHTISFIHPKSAHVMQENTKEKVIVNVKTFFRQYAWLGWEFEITPKRTQSVTIDMRTQHGIEEQFIIAFFCYVNKAEKRSFVASICVTTFIWTIALEKLKIVLTKD